MPANNGSEPPRSQLEHRVRFRKKSLRNAPGGTVRQHVCRQWYVAICERGSPYIVYYCGRGFHRLREHLQTHTCTRCSGPGRLRFIIQPLVAILLGIRDGEYRHAARRRDHGESNGAALFEGRGKELSREAGLESRGTDAPTMPATVPRDPFNRPHRSAQACPHPAASGAPSSDPAS